MKTEVDKRFFRRSSLDTFNGAIQSEYEFHFDNLCISLIQKSLLRRLSRRDSNSSRTITPK